MQGPGLAESPGEGWDYTTTPTCLTPCLQQLSFHLQPQVGCLARTSLGKQWQDRTSRQMTVPYLVRTRVRPACPWVSMRS